MLILRFCIIHVYFSLNNNETNKTFYFSVVISIFLKFVRMSEK